MIILRATKPCFLFIWLYLFRNIYTYSKWTSLISVYLFVRYRTIDRGFLPFVKCASGLGIEVAANSWKLRCLRNNSLYARFCISNTVNSVFKVTDKWEHSWCMLLCFFVPLPQRPQISISCRTIEIYIVIWSIFEEIVAKNGWLFVLGSNEITTTFKRDVNCNS